MIRTREELEDIERRTLAPWAQKSGDTAGREHAEPRHPHRTEYQRDRARVIHSRSFRRLEYKTQVFLNGTGDHLRTRLTHTFEVANISRSIARSLALNEDLAEVIALAHDLGHPPFGHSGEETLDELMRDHGGFDHNAQSLRIVDVVETRYPKFAGLNLSHEVREGLQKHAKFYQKAGDRGTHPQPSLEAQLANLADEITYYSHDLDDGLDFELLDPAQLAQLDVWRESAEDVRRHFPRLKGRELHAYVIRCIIDRQVADVVRTSAELIEKAAVQSADDVRRHPKPLIAYSRPLLKANQQLRRFLYKNLYYHPGVAGANQRACGLLSDVFGAYLKKPALLGRSTSRRVKADGLHRTVCDYVSGMTDRYLIEEHGRLFAKTEKRRER
jgi:dGTPase